VSNDFQFQHLGVFATVLSVGSSLVFCGFMLEGQSLSKGAM